MLVLGISNSDITEVKFSRTLDFCSFKILDYVMLENVDFHVLGLTGRMFCNIFWYLMTFCNKYYHVPGSVSCKSSLPGTILLYLFGVTHGTGMKRILLFFPYFHTKCYFILLHLIVNSKIKQF